MGGIGCYTADDDSQPSKEILDMEVLHIVPTLSPLDGGTTSSVLDLATGLQRLGVSVTVATTTGHGKEDFSWKDGESVEREGVRIVYFRRHWPKSWKYSPGMRRWLQESISRYDILHTHSLFCYPEIPAINSAKSQGIPVVLSPAGMHDAWSLSQRRWKKLPYYHLIERRVLRKTDVIHVTAESEKRGFISTPYYDKCVVIPLGVKVDNCVVGPKVKKAKGLDLLFLARIHPKKGLPVLFRSISSLLALGMDVRLTIAGDGDPQYVADMKELCRTLGIWEHVQFIGFVEGEAKQDLICRSDLYVLPSYQENFGISVVEAMAYGLPVIITDQIGISGDIVRFGAGVVVPADSEKDVVEAIVKLSDGKRSEDAGQAGISLFEREYSYINQAKKMLSVYKRLLKGGRFVCHENRRAN